jgi:hypothetical protein
MKTIKMLSVQELINKLKLYNEGSKVILGANVSNHLLINFGLVDSYRGYYEQLCIEGSTQECCNLDAIVKLEQIIGKTVDGYKGGTYEIYKDTPIWVSEYSIASGFAVVDATYCPITDTIIIQSVYLPLN